MLPRDSASVWTGKLNNCVIVNNAEGVRNALEHGAKVDGLSKGLRTPLHTAAMNGNLEVVRLLCGHHANTKLRSLLDKGMQPLHLAAKHGHSEVVEELITRGADCNERYNKGMQAVHLAAANDRVEVLRVLQRHVCDLETAARDGATPLHLAAEHNCVSAARWLVDKGVALTVRNQDLLTPEDCARRRTNLDLAEIIRHHLEKAPEEYEDKQNCNKQTKPADPRHGGSPRLTQPTKSPKDTKPIVVGRKVMVVKDTNFTPEHAKAVEFKVPKPSFAKPVKQHEATEDKPGHRRDMLPPAPNETKPSFTQAARPAETIEHRQRNMRERVLPAPNETKPHATTQVAGPTEATKAEPRTARPVPCKTKPSYGRGVQPRETKPSEAPKEMKQYPNETKPSHDTPNTRKSTADEARVELKLVTAAAAGGGVEAGGGRQEREEDEAGVLCRLLGNPTRVDGEGDSSGDSGIYPATSEPAEEELVEAVSEGKYETVSRLLNEGVSTEIRSRRDGERGLRPLHLATWSGHDDIVRLLLDHQANRKAMAHGLAPVHWTAVGGHVGVLALLWDEGFSVKARAEDGATALHLAADHGNLEAVTWLVDKGAYLQVKDKRGNTPKALAIQAGNKGIVKFLQEKEDEMRLENMTEKKKLGEGSFGDVYLVRTGNKQVVVKKIDLSQLNRRQQEYAHSEFRTLKTLDHPYIVAYKGGGFQGRYLNIHMEFCSGGDLSARIEEQRTKGGAFEEKQVHNWVLRLCLALKYIHGRKILHRDIKPHNIFLSDSGTIKLGDFGLVRVLGEGSVMAATSLGTPAYMSPEVLQGVPYDTKADMWSLGCCLYELAALERGFPYTQVKVPGVFSRDYKRLVWSLLQRDATKRPDAREVLALPFLVDVMGVQLEGREQEVAGLNLEVQELSDEVTEMTRELERLRARRVRPQEEVKPK